MPVSPTVLRRCSAAVLLVAFCAFVGFFVLLAISRPLCCADDAAHAVIAKNVAWGHGYANSLGHNTDVFAFRRFDPVIGTGPTIILPAAVAVAVFGNGPSVPGLTAIALWAALCLCLYSVARVLEPRRAVPAALCFLVMCFVLSPFNAPQWFALLGEVPTALLVVLAYAMLVRSRSAADDAAAGLVMGLSLAAKLLSLIYVAPALAFLAYRDRRLGAPQAGRTCARFLMAVAAPLAMFEIWKAATLGANYFASLGELVRFISATGIAPGEQSVLGRAGSRLDGFRDRYGIPLPLLLFAAGLAGWLVMRSANSGVRALFVLGCAGAAIHVIYWVLLSNGNPRYAFSTVLILAALISLGLLATGSRSASAAFTVFLAACLAVPAGRTPFYLTFFSSAALSGEPAPAQKAAEFLDRERNGRAVLTQWWATAAALEYASREVWIFDSYSRNRVPLRGSGTLIAYSKHFLLGADADFAAAIKECGPPVLAVDPYYVHRC